MVAVRCTYWRCLCRATLEMHELTLVIKADNTAYYSFVCPNCGQGNNRQVSAGLRHTLERSPITHLRLDEEATDLPPITFDEVQRFTTTLYGPNT